MKKWGGLFFHGLFLWLVVSCTERTSPAPVKESQWAPFNKHAKIYQVREGDTLFAIAFRYNVEVEDLAKVNKIPPPYIVKAGKSLHLTSTVALKPRVRRNTQTVKHRWTWPVAGRVIETFNPRLGKKGINIACKPHTTVVAAETGLVVYAGNGLPGYKNLILIRHPNHYLTAYAYNDILKVNEGDKVKKGGVIAYSGKTHKQQGALHFEIRKNGIPVNPVEYLLKG